MIELICGGMFSGKSERLLQMIERSGFAKKKIQLFTHVKSRRYGKEIGTRSGRKIPANKLETSQEVFQNIEVGVQVVAIDEVQFFDIGLVDVIIKLAKAGVKIVCAGLDKDYRSLPFLTTALISCVADRVLKLQAVCEHCGGDASESYKKISDDGKSFTYVPLCRLCFLKENPFPSIYSLEGLNIHSITLCSS